MLAKYAVFTILTSIISFLCFNRVEEPYKGTLRCVALEDSVHDESEMLFTSESLSKYSGNNEKLYLSVLGEVFDVTKGKKHYGAGKAYSGFTGKDGSRAFVSGDFTEEGLTDDVLDLPVQDLLSLSEWSKFYHKDYTYKGKLIGRYYDSAGRPTGYYYKLQQRLVEAEKNKEVSEEFKLSFPPCNVEFDVNTGSRVWCSMRSGGIEREWVGVPRKIFEPGSSTHRCACVNLLGHSTDEERNLRVKNIEEYEDCHPQATSCHVHM